MVDLLKESSGGERRATFAESVFRNGIDVPLETALTAKEDLCSN